MDVARAKLHKGKPVFEKRLGSPKVKPKGMKTSEKLTLALSQIEPLVLRERLMLIAVREIAISLHHSNVKTKHSVAALLPPVKADRLWSELEFLKRLDISFALYSKVTEKFIGLLNGVGDVTHHSYLRPSRK